MACWSLHLEYGVVRQLLERPLMRVAVRGVQARLLAGPRGTGRHGCWDWASCRPSGGPCHDPSAGILHALHWLTANLSDAVPRCWS